MNARKALAALTTAFALAAASVSMPALAADKKVTISQAFQSMLYLPLYVAIDGGFFAREGLDVNKQTAGSPSAALSAVLSGSAEFSLHGPEWTAVAAEKGADVDVIANVVNGAAVWIAVAPGVKFNSIKDVKDQVVVSGQMPTTSTSLFFKLLKENGMSQSDVKLMQVPLGSEIGPLVAAQAKIAVMYEPGLDQAVAKGMKVVLGFPQHYGEYAFSSITAKRSVDPDAAARFVKGLQGALSYMQSNPAETAAIARKEFPTLDPVVVDAAVKRMLTEGVYPKSVDITPQALKVAMDTQIALGNLKAQPKYDAFIVHTYIQPALAAK
ncbi:NitT/TauT family transport system substrate-binding protein [Paraburkholderia sp. BL6669N2]|uniref:ABC transporter substrate-binding protein n=1 Tax=unclassified Paraburkholderia TaxID=2615204 RepID=UPI000E23261B|nr:MULTISPECIES: ABC transporter substrate-binding protein [unclassified Paraburkholderia]REG48892.1 NitT/TauT family transport system substrate-binding protein [Paraburkholderia sp. BL6669N2]TDY21367.1 NitT/TauT family transport system substrate-binding protein [Paraburkholderia sp. BL6665CI2N2]